MKNPKSIASLLIFVGSTLCFFLPFVTVSCAGIKLGTFTGQQLATGVHPAQTLPGVSVNTQGYNGDPLTAVAFLCAIAGIGLSLAGRKLAAVTAGSGGVGAAALLIMRARLTDQIQTQIVGQIQNQMFGQGQGIVQVNFEPGLMFAVSLLAAGAALNLYVLFHREKSAPAVTDASLGETFGSLHVSGTGDTAGIISNGSPTQQAAAEPQRTAQIQAQAGGAARAARFCRHCGTSISEGKRFCSHCGSETAQTQETPKPAAVTLEETPGPELPVVSDETATPAAAAVFASAAAPAPFVAPPAGPAQTSSAYVEPNVAGSSIETEEQPAVAAYVKRRGATGWLITAVVSVIMISVGAFWAYEWHRGVTVASLFGRSNGSEPESSPQSQSQPQSQGQLQPQTPNPAIEATKKPSPSGSETHTSAPATSPASNKQPVTTSSQGNSTAEKSEVVSTQLNVPSYDNTPSIPPRISQPQPPLSGILHYSGPPVHLGETVTFVGLPGGRLRFTFDHAAWQPLISRQPDGTQTLTLRSLTQAVQTRCDVSWSIVQ